MKIYRFMSNAEFDKYLKNKTLINEKDHSKTTNGTSTSKGFCFFSLDSYKPEYALHFLNGIVDLDVCVVFEVDRSKLIKSKAQYAKPIIRTGDWLIDITNLYADWFNKLVAKEYCCTTYNKNDFKLIKYSKNIAGQYAPYGEQQDFKWENKIIID